MLLEIEQKEHDGAGLLSLSGVLDLSTVDEFIYSFEYFRGAQKLIIDFDQIKFIDSTGIGGIVQVIKKCRERQISLTITNIHKEIFEIFDILGFPRFLGTGYLK